MRGSACHLESVCHDVLNMLGDRSMRWFRRALMPERRSPSGEIASRVLSSIDFMGATAQRPERRNDGHALLLHSRDIMNVEVPSWLQMPSHATADYRIVALNDNDYSR